MAIVIEIPNDLEQRLREDVPNLDVEAREAVALDLFRKEKLTHYELGQILGLSRSETNTFLMDRKEYAQSPTLEDLENDYQTINNIMAADGR
jgi:predicted HTH domain antitoxin